MQKRISNYDSISSVVGLVENALLVALAGQRYIRRVLGQPDATRAIEKGVTSSANSPGGQVIDFVTEADFAVQEIAENIFFHPKYAPKCFSAKNIVVSEQQQASATNNNKIPQISFIGEETLPLDPKKSELHHFAWFEDILATETSQEYKKLLKELRNSCRILNKKNNPADVIVDPVVENTSTAGGDADDDDNFNTSVTPPNEVDNNLLSNVVIPPPSKTSTNTNNDMKGGERTTTTRQQQQQQKPPTVQIYVDPIDGTNAMVAGKKKVPMTLIGVCLSGVPVAGVINRVFAGDPNYILNKDFSLVDYNNTNKSDEKKTSENAKNNTATTNPCPETISLCIENGPCWIDGRRVVSVQSMEEEFQREAFEKFLRVSSPSSASSKKTTPSTEFLKNKKLNILAGSNGKAKHDLIYRYLEPGQWFETRGAGHKLLALATGASILGDYERVLKSQQNISILRENHAQKQQQQQQQNNVNNNNSSSSTGAIPRPIKINSDAMPTDIIFDLFVAKGQVTKWDTAAPHAFLRWLNADMYRIVDVPHPHSLVDSSSSNNNNSNLSSTNNHHQISKLQFMPIDYTEQSGNLEKFSGFDVSLEPRVIATINPVMTSLAAERLGAVVVASSSNNNDTTVDGYQKPNSKL